MRDWEASDVTVPLKVIASPYREVTRPVLDYVKRIADEGHEIGNHSLTHPHMNILSREEVQQEIIALDDTIEKLTGKRCTLFRAPFGEYNNTVVTAVREIGYEVVQWSRDTVDWKENRSTQQILDGVLGKLTSGDIILCHNNGFRIEEYHQPLADLCRAYPILLKAEERMVAQVVGAKVTREQWKQGGQTVQVFYIDTL